ncbi:MAG: hypothetical protein SNI70_11480 [Rikenellaceae bacterium]
MANNCITCLKIFGDKEEISQLYEKLSTLTEKNSEYYQKFIEARSTNAPLPEYPPEITETTPCLWLGDIVSYFGGNNKEVECRGTLDYFDLLSDTIIWIVTDTAWHPMPEMWDIVIKDYPSLKFYYLAEECGCEIYINSDPTGEYFDALYQVDHFGNDTEDVASEEALFAHIANILEVEKIESFEELDELLEVYNDDNPDEEIHYHKYEPPTP